MKKEFRVLPFVIIAALSMAACSNDTATFVATKTLEKNSLENTISVTGVVKSSVVENLYANNGGVIKTLNVKIGDRVKKGDVLAELDDLTLRQQIMASEKNLSVSENSNYNNLNNSEKEYLNLLDSLENNSNFDYNSAQANVVSSQLKYDDAKKNYDKAMENFNGFDADGDIAALKKSYETARLAEMQYEVQYKKLLEENYTQTRRDEIYSIEKTMETIKGTKMDAKYLEDSERYDNHYKMLASKLDSQTLAVRQQLESARSSFDDVDTKLKKINKDYADQLDSAKNALTVAELTLEQAKLSFDNTKTNLTDKLEKAKQSYDLAKQNIDDDADVLALQSLKQKLDECIFKAPVDGVVTAVNGEEGGAFQNLAVTIQDTSKLIVAVNVKEYDIAYVENGMKVTVKSDALSGEKYEGKVTKVSSVGVSATSGNSTETVFPVEIEITSTDTQLLIGMSAKCEIITDEVDNAYAVNYDSVGTDDKTGESYIMVAEKSGDSYTVKKIAVTAGLETDIETQIEAPELTDGMLVITDISEVKDGDTVKVKNRVIESDSATGDSTSATEEMAG